jgi:hypothetical protein
MIQPKNIVVNVGLLLDAIGAAGGMKKFARRCGVDTGKINMLLRGEIPNPGPLWRICQGGKFKPSELIINAATFAEEKRRRGQLVHYRRRGEQESQDAS